MDHTRHLTEPSTHLSNGTSQAGATFAVPTDEQVNGVWLVVPNAEAAAAAEAAPGTHTQQQQQQQSSKKSNHTKRTKTSAALLFLLVGGAAEPRSSQATRNDSTQTSDWLLVPPR
jgi:hypothetical protein